MRRRNYLILLCCSMLIVFFTASTVIILTNKKMAPIQVFAGDFFHAVKNQDEVSIKNMMDDKGFYSITYFTDGRDRNVVLHIEKNEVRDDLVLVSDNKVGITMDGMFAGMTTPFRPSRLKIHTSDMLSTTVYPVDFEKSDEEEVTNHLQGIINTSIQINLIDNEFVPQLFALKDGYYAFVRGKAASVPENGLIGDWVIFRQVGDKYVLRAIMFFE